MFKKAERRQVKLKIAIAGPAGSGKTYSALRLASGMGKKIALIDTENDSAALYADKFNFDTLTLSAPFTVPKYTEAMKAAAEAGYEVLVIDSISHAWAAEGGLLDKKEAMDSRGGNSFSNWGKITKEHEAFKSAFLNSPLHVICTMRSKQEYALETGDKGRTEVKRKGLAPIQRDGMEYEFTTLFEVAIDHNASASKDRTGLFDGQIFRITEDTGKTLMAWIASAKPEELAKAAPKPEEPKKGALSQPEVHPDLKCTKCGGKMREHASVGGYICENALVKDDGHLRVLKSDLPKHLQKQSA